MDAVDIERIASRVAEKLMEPLNRQALAEAIATELRRLGVRYAHDMEMLGQQLDARHY